MYTSFLFMSWEVIDDAVTYGWKHKLRGNVEREEESGEGPNYALRLDDKF